MAGGFGGYLEVLRMKAAERGDTVFRIAYTDTETENLVSVFGEMNDESFEFSCGWTITFDDNQYMLLFMSIADATTFKFRYPGTLG